MRPNGDPVDVDDFEKINCLIFLKSSRQVIVGMYKCFNCGCLSGSTLHGDRILWGGWEVWTNGGQSVDNLCLVRLYMIVWLYGRIG